MTLEARVALGLGTFSLDVAIDAAPGQLVVLVGPNGAGKTTLLRALAGLQPVDEGRITLDGAVLDDGMDRWSPPHRRSVGLVPQRDHLLPHLTALENIAFGLRHRGTPRREAVRQAREWVEVTGLGGLEHHRPAALSGGQAKRVALARALAVRPRLLLLDEPLASLDAAAHRQIRRELRNYLRSHDGVQLLVTHEPLDALALADRVVVIEDGRVVQDVVPDELRVRPRSRYVAELVGVNLFAGTVRAGRIVTSEGAEIVAAEPLPDAGAVHVVVHPRAVALHLQRPEGSPRNTWHGTVAEVDDEGSVMRVRIAAPLALVAEITATSARDLGIARGTPVFVTVKATEVTVYPA